MSAILNLIVIIEELVGDDQAGKRALADIKAELAADEAAEKADADAITALTGRVSALEGASTGGGGTVDLGPLTARVDALEARNAADDAAAGGLPDPNQPPVSTLVLSPAVLPDAVVGQPYTASVAAGGSTALPFSFSIASGALPDGLSLGAGGGISGTPTTVGSSQVSIQAHDTNGDVGSADYTMVVGDVAAPPAPASLTIDPSTVSAAVGVALTVPVSISGGVAPYSASGLADGVAFDGADLVFDTTTAAGSSTVTFTDSSSVPLTGSVAVSIA